jgi:hypothetical protein
MTEMQTYKDYSPTGFDVAGLGCEDRQDWFVAPCGTNRDADALTRANFKDLTAILERIDPELEDHETHRFGHWACGWFEIVLVRPGSEAAEECGQIEDGLADYPVICEETFSAEEREEADSVWQDCYSYSERVAYIRKRRSDFDFYDLGDMLGCVRGEYFAGHASELLG